MKRLAVAVGTALALAGVAAGVVVAAFSATTSNPTSSFTAERIYAGNRTTSAWVIDDAAAGASKNATQNVAVLDGTVYATGNWSPSFASNRFVDFTFNSPLAAGLTASGVRFNFSLRSNGGADTACFYVEVYRASTSTLLGTHGTSGSPIACPNSTITTYSVALSELTSTTDLNDLKVRVYANESKTKPIAIDRATVTGATYTDFTLYTRLLGDQSTATLTSTPWGIAVAGDGAFFQNTGSWAASFASTRYVNLTFPRMTPASATVTGATFDLSYRPNTNGNSACYYIEVYSGGMLLATHGSTSSTISCNTSNTTYQTDATSLPEVSTPAIANSLSVRVYFKNSGARPVQFDLADVQVNYSLGYGSGCADAGTRVLTPTGDTYVQQDSAAVNFGTATTLIVKSQSGARNRRGYLLFDVPGALGSGCSLTSATLQANASAVQGTRTINAVQAAGTWVETVVTWTNQPGSTGTPVGTSNTPGWESWTVTSIVSNLISGTNYGIVLTDSAEDSAAAVTQTYSSREGGNPAQLSITVG